MSLTPRDVIAEGLRAVDSCNAGISADVAMSFLARAGFAIVPTALLESAADALENEWPNGGDNPGMRAARAMRACLNQTEPTP